MKQKLYPSTHRVAPSKFTITEKLDGSNIGFFKLEGDLIIAQRNNVYNLKEIKNLNKDDLYKGLDEWLYDNSEELLDSLYEGAGFFGEWIGMGRLKYDFENKVYMFAKANIKWVEELNQYEIYNRYYEQELFIYPFINQKIPRFISTVPIVGQMTGNSIDDLNIIYTEYVKTVKRDVEGFVIIYSKDNIKKYVRMKSGSLEDHFW